MSSPTVNDVHVEDASSKELRDYIRRLLQRAGRTDLLERLDRELEDEKGDLAKTSFSDSPWNSPESDLPTAAAYCSVCLIDANEPGTEKVKGKCHLPIRSTPGGPVNKNALRNAAARLNQVRGVSAEDKAKAKARLISLMHAAGIDTSLEKEDASEEVVVESASIEALTAPIEKIEVTILKTDEPKRLSYGVAYPLLPEGQFDLQGDRASADEIEKMAHDYMLKSRGYDLHHIVDVAPEDAQIVESYIAPTDFAIADKFITKGSWIVVTHYSPTFWEQRVAKGEIAAYSIRGTGIRTRMGGNGVIGG